MIFPRIISRFAASFSASALCSILCSFSAQSADGNDAIGADKHQTEAVRLMKAGEDDQALVEFDKGLKCSPAASLYNHKAQCLLNLGRPKEALEAAKTAVKLNPTLPDNHSVLGSCYDACHQDAEALSEFTVAINKKPTDRGFRSWRSRFYEHHHEYAKAIGDLTVLIANTDKINLAKPLERRAACYIALNDYTKAIADYDAALAVSVGRSDLLRLRAAAHEKQGNHAAAQKDLKAAEAVDEAFEPPSTMGREK